MYCKYHQKKWDKENKERHKEYQRRRRKDKEQRKYQDFYNSKSWSNLSELIKNHFFGMCVICWLRGEIREGKYTHHIEELGERFDLRLDKDNLVCLCPSCHQKVHNEYNKGKKEEERMKRILYETIKKFEEEFY